MIRNTYTNKDHGHDDVTIGMIKICDFAIVKPISMTHKNCNCLCEFRNI